MSNWNRHSEVDPLKALEDEAKRQHLEEKADKAIATAMTRLVIGNGGSNKPACLFFGSLAFKIAAHGRRKVCWDIDTAATDGKYMYYNPEFICSLNQDELIGVVAHEVMHPAHRHLERKEWREQRGFNIAADASINPIIEESGLKLPSFRIMPGEGPFKQWPKGQSMEWYYANLPKKKKGKGQGDGDGDGCGQGNDPGRCGGMVDPKDISPAQARELAADWQAAVSQAHQIAKQCGRLPAGIERMVEEILEPVVDWKSVLAEFITASAKTDYSWSPPNRRFVYQGLYLPGMRGESLGLVAVAIDASGSCYEDKTQGRFLGEVVGIAQAYDCQLLVIYHDCAVQHHFYWSPEEGDIPCEYKGGGGTSHIPVFDWIEEQGIEPSCLVAFTDMYSCFPNDGPDYPVLWAMLPGSTQQAPFGRHLEIPNGDE